MGDVVERAFRAYFKAGGNIQPSNGSGIQEVKGRTYVVLINVNGILAVYRVKNNGVLRGLKRWPRALETY
jgi:hypothetical protein